MKKNIIILYGGETSECDISIASAKNIVNNIDKTKFNFEFIFINKEGKWLFKKEIDDIGKDIYFKIAGFFYFQDDKIINLKFDLVFLALHGKKYEDGQLQGFLNSLKIKYTGSKQQASILGFNKKLAKDLVNKEGINIVPYFFIKKNDYNLDSIIEFNDKIKYPLFIKPNKEGSSVGITKLEDSKDLLKALDYAFAFSNEILIEKAIIGSEIECAILEKDGELLSFDPCKIDTNNNFYDYKLKYQDKGANIEYPACLKDKDNKLIKEISLIIFKALACKSYARVDFFISKEDKIYFNEINTLPGFTDSSMFALMCNIYSSKEIITIIIENELK